MCLYCFECFNSVFLSVIIENVPKVWVGFKLFFKDLTNYDFVFQVACH